MFVKLAAEPFWYLVKSISDMTVLLLIQLASAPVTVHIPAVC